jgi:uncharacterized membrane protein YcjF (UPF0283 family)
MEYYYWLTTAVAILISAILIVLSLITCEAPKAPGFKVGRKRRRLRRVGSKLSMILVSIATGLFVKIIADLFYEVVNNNFPKYSNITKIVLACALLIIIIILYVRSSHDS